MMIERLIAALLYLPHALFRRPDRWLFVIPRKKPFNGNLRALCDALMREDRVGSVLIYNRGTTPDADIRTLYAANGKTVFVGRGVGAYLRCLTADVMFVNALRRFSLPVFSVNLWHGIPIKEINLFERPVVGLSTRPWRKPRRNRTGDKAFNLNDRVIAGSQHDRVIMSASFGLTPANVYVSGLPRNDWLFGPLPSDLALDETRLLKRLAGKKLCLYAPTFRDEDRRFVPMSKAQLVALADALQVRGFVLGFRPHPFMRDFALPEHPAFLKLTGDVIAEPQVILRQTDILITDYSSIAIDFLLLGRPVFSFAPDHDRFSRGYYYDLKHAFPGPFHEQFDRLLKDVESTLDSPAHKVAVLARQKQVRSLFHEPGIKNASQTLIDLIMKERRAKG
jgi:CDP-glycerol glycerophosphotransferase (TagB/SpsB family)